MGGRRGGGEATAGHTTVASGPKGEVVDILQTARFGGPSCLADASQDAGAAYFSLLTYWMEG